MSIPIISIITPVKNGAAYLRECLDSIIAQTESGWELCIIDDNSSDETWEILYEYQQLDARIKPRKSNGVGIIPALQTGYQSSTGQYITRMDADDQMAPQKLETMGLLLSSKGKGYLALGGVDYFSDVELGDGYKKYASWLNSLTATGNNWVDIYKECVIPSPCWMLHREDFDKCGGFDSDQYPEDYDLCFRMYADGLTIIPCDQVLHQWRDYPERTSRNYPNYADNRFLDLKLHWFAQLELDNPCELVIWGAGRKGKLIAKHFVDNNIDISWITTNPKKIGHNIYQQILKHPDKVDLDKSNVIVAVSNPSEQEEILALLKALGKNKGKDIFLFC